MDICRPCMITSSSTGMIVIGPFLGISSPMGPQLNQLLNSVITKLSSHSLLISLGRYREAFRRSAPSLLRPAPSLLRPAPLYYALHHPYYALHHVYCCTIFTAPCTIFTAPSTYLLCHAPSLLRPAPSLLLANFPAHVVAHTSTHVEGAHTSTHVVGAHTSTHVGGAYACSSYSWYISFEDNKP